MISVQKFKFCIRKNRKKRESEVVILNGIKQERYTLRFYEKATQWKRSSRDNWNTMQETNRNKGIVGCVVKGDNMWKRLGKNRCGYVRTEIREKGYHCKKNAQTGMVAVR